MLNTHLRESVAAKKTFLDSIEGIPYSQTGTVMKDSFDRSHTPNFLPDPLFKTMITDSEND
jgi:hypothetical protein